LIASLAAVMAATNQLDIPAAVRVLRAAAVCCSPRSLSVPTTAPKMPAEIVLSLADEDCGDRMTPPDNSADEPHERRPANDRD